jgi:hypothetical protein
VRVIDRAISVAMIDNEAAAISTSGFALTGVSVHA